MWHLNRDIDWAIQQKAPPTCKHILFILANRADKNHKCFPSLTRIASDTGIERRSVMRCLLQLESLGLIEREQRGIQTTIYTLKVGTHSPYKKGHIVPRDSMSLGTVRHLDRDIQSPQVGTVCPTEPKEEPKVNRKQGDLHKRTKAPDSLLVTEAMRKWAKEKKVIVDLEAETEAMLDWHRGKGNLQLDWVATWRTWMRNSVKFAKTGGNGNGRKYRSSEELSAINTEVASRFINGEVDESFHGVLSYPAGPHADGGEN